CGWPATEGTVKDAKRRGKLVLGTVQHLTVEEERFAKIVFFVRPGCELDRFAAEGSPAHAVLTRLREEAVTPAYDDDGIPDDLLLEDMPLDADEPLDWDIEDDLPDDALPEDWPDEDWMLDWGIDQDLPAHQPS